MACEGALVVLVVVGVLAGAQEAMGAKALCILHPGGWLVGGGVRAVWGDGVGSLCRPAAVSWTDARLNPTPLPPSAAGTARGHQVLCDRPARQVLGPVGAQLLEP